MPKLPEIVDFDESRFPGLQHIFRELDSAIAAIVQSDPGFRAKSPSPRRGRASRRSTHAAAGRRHARQVAA